MSCSAGFVQVIESTIKKKDMDKVGPQNEPAVDGQSRDKLGSSLVKNTKRGVTRKCRKGLRRPRTPLNYQIPSLQQPGHATTLTQPDSITCLSQRILLLHLAIRRNKNQHRAQPFFKYLSLLHKSLARLLTITKSLAAVSAQPATTSDQVRRKFEKEASLRSQREVLEEHVREVLVPKCYVTFSTVVADSQFANLGVVLMGLLAEVAAGAHGVGLPSGVGGVEDEASSRKGRREGVEIGSPGSLLGLSTRVTGEDQGEVIERRYDHVGRPTGDEGAAVVANDDFERFGESADIQVNVTTTAKLQRPDTAIHPANQDLLPIYGSNMSGQQIRKKTKKHKDAIDDLFSGLF
ncbi:RNase MRP subunit [Lithohypha guttulata]|uniref:RNase MRP subunit n=1 Tax=Lithohypha guttulata TaxID=1690604 RepID=A0AAN7SWY7_9EURO|nr:RNase MRP subunit [Lithohypha guttulata]